MKQSHDKKAIERVLSVDGHALFSKWSLQEEVGSLLLDARKLADFDTIRCVVTGKPLGQRSMQYLADMVRVHGMPRARFVMQIEAAKTKEHLTAYQVIGETLKDVMLQDPVTFFMHACSDYLGWHVDKDYNLEQQAEKVWAMIVHKANAWDNLHTGMKSGLLKPGSLLEACELLRRYLAIAGKHKQWIDTKMFVEYLTAETVTTTIMGLITTSLRERITTLLQDVRKMRKDIKSKTNLISETKAIYGGMSNYHALSRTDKFFSADEAVQVILETMGVDILPQNDIELDAVQRRVLRMKKAMQGQPVYAGKVHIAEENAPIIIKFGGK